MPSGLSGIAPDGPGSSALNFSKPFGPGHVRSYWKLSSLAQQSGMVPRGSVDRCDRFVPRDGLSFKIQYLESEGGRCPSPN